MGLEAGGFGFEVCFFVEVTSGFSVMESATSILGSLGHSSLFETNSGRMMYSYENGRARSFISAYWNFPFLTYVIGRLTESTVHSSQTWSRRWNPATWLSGKVQRVISYRSKALNWRAINWVAVMTSVYMRTSYISAVRFSCICPKTEYTRHKSEAIKMRDLYGSMFLKFQAISNWDSNSSSRDLCL